MRSRLVLLLILLVVLWSAMIGRAAYLQILPNARLESLRKKQFETVVTLRSRRGDVLDRKGQELAISTMSHSLFADPKMLEDAKWTARFLSKELKTPFKPLYDKLKQRKKRFVWLQRHLERSVRDAIEAKKIKGLGFIEESKRTYPNESLLSQVLGFIGSEGNGLEGLESRYNDELAANKRNVAIQRDARGRPLIVGGQLFTEAPDGSDIHLTIDRELQYTLEQELRSALNAHEADAAIGIILDAQTSEILAMANAPAFDPNHPSEFAPDRRRNRTLTDAFEPGSTMKTFVVGAALAKGLVEPNTKFNCENGSMKIGKRTIREADSKHRWDMLTVTEILAKSSNIGTAKIAMKLGAAELRESLLAFGFGARTGVDLPGEVKGILQPMPWREHLLSNISFGHGIAATPLQIANAYAAIANGGWLKRPYIVRKIHNYESGETQEIGPKTVRRVLMPEVAAKLKLMLSTVTGADATGWNARVVGFPVAGKTGTAQKVNVGGRGYLPDAYLSSFAGFFPVNDPRFVIYVAVDNPRKGYYGSQVAAPIFSKVAAFAARQAGLSPILITESDVMRRPEIPVTSASAQAEQTAETKMAIRTASGPETSTEKKSGTKVVASAPTSEPMSILSPGSASANVVPDLGGLTLREVVRRMNGSGLA
ncbi:MAG: penicillin-binding protein 2, partial [Bdellovibrionaceae bacterium]|nr:penicillin-binding protein 2 [Pseudobdellovibrionaceae bacterium]